jgi:transposase
MHLDEWIDNNETVEISPLTSQRVSELLSSFSIKEHIDFFKLWIAKIREKEYIALDITSVSSYSKGIIEAEKGKNKDNEKLPQVNICMLYGEQSYLPMYQTIFQGSMNDVKTLKSIVTEFSGILDDYEFRITMDKGFYSRENIEFLLKKKINFLISAPFTCNFAKQLVDRLRNTMDNYEKIIWPTNDCDLIRGVTEFLQWDNIKQKIYVHIFFDPKAEHAARNTLYKKISELENIVLKKPNDKKNIKEIEKYFIIKKLKNIINLEIRSNVVEKELATSGWFILISNNIQDKQEAYNIYRKKDVVEKSFWQYKNRFGLKRFHVHNSERMKNKVFISFIALILHSHIHKIMQSHNLYSSLTFDELISQFSKLQSYYVRGEQYVRPMSKSLRELFEIFEINPPPKIHEK